MLDHHVSNAGFGDVQILDPCAEATVVLVHRLLGAMHEAMDPGMARCLYAGLVTDTRNFRDAGPAAHRLAAELIEAGADPHALVTPIMDTHPFPWLAVLADLLRAAELDPTAAQGLGMVHTVIPAEYVARFRQEEVDGVVDTLRTAAEAEVAAVIKQVGPARWTVSLRSRGRVDVAAAAAALGGGGHRRAAGVTIDGTAGEVVAALRAVLSIRHYRGRGRRRRLSDVPEPRRSPSARDDGRGHPWFPCRGRPRTPDPRAARRAFLAAALRNPGKVGAIAPTSETMAEVLARIVPLAGAPVVVELGPGTGAVTGVIDDRLARERATSRSSWTRTWPPSWGAPTRAGGDQGDAVKLGALLAEHGVTKADAVVSGLPWALFDDATQRRSSRRSPTSSVRRAPSAPSPTGTACCCPPPAGSAACCTRPSRRSWSPRRCGATCRPRSSTSVDARGSPRSRDRRGTRPGAATGGHAPGRPRAARAGRRTAVPAGRHRRGRPGWARCRWPGSPSAGVVFAQVTGQLTFLSYGTTARAARLHGAGADRPRSARACRPPGWRWPSGWWCSASGSSSRGRWPARSVTGARWRRPRSRGCGSRCAGRRWCW